jgi:ATP-dependent Clp protease ATP-binding subunit ClpC
MFDKYTEKARRVVFFARQEASQFGSSAIESEHLLLGILREDEALINRFLRSDASVVSIRARIEALSGKRKPLPPNQDLPLAAEAKRVLTYAAEEAKELASDTISTEHVFLGLLRVKSGMAASLLNEHGVKISAVREEPAKPESAKEPAKEATAEPPATAAGGHSSSAAASVVASSTNGLFRDLTKAAADGVFDPIVGRDVEIDIVIEVLCGNQRRNPILVGSLGAGKTAIVQGLAQRIAAGQVPGDLADKRIIEVEPELVAAWTSDRKRFDEFIDKLSTVSNPSHSILLVDCFLRLASSQTHTRWINYAGFLEWTLSQPAMRCIAIAEDKEFPLVAQWSPWLVQEFRELRVRPLSEEATLVVLQNRKRALEKFHGVIYAEESLEAAMRAATRDMSGATLPRTAIELLDVAGNVMKLRRGKPPMEVIECQKKLASIAELKKNAMQKQELDKARALAEEERREQETLRGLQKKAKPKSTGPETITPEDVKAVIARWTAYPYSV